MCHLIDAVFNSPTNPTAILFLVEDTDLMTSLQHSLRDSYLLMILEAVYKNKSLGLAKALWMSTSDLFPLEVPPDILIYRQLLQDYTNLTNDHCRFATPASILSAIKALSAAFGGAAVTRHLVIFAGLGPSFLTLQDMTPWNHAICRLKEEDILVHFVTPTQYTGNLTMFYQNLISEGSIFQSLTDGTCFSFRLTAPAGPLIDTAYSERALGSSVIPEADYSVSRPPAHITTPLNELGLAHQLQKVTGVERKGRSQTRRVRRPYSKPSHQTGPQTPTQRPSKSPNAPFNTHPAPPSSFTPSPDDSQLSIRFWKLTRDG